MMSRYRGLRCSGGKWHSVTDRRGQLSLRVRSRRPDLLSVLGQENRYSRKKLKVLLVNRLHRLSESSAFLSCEVRHGGGCGAYHAGDDPPHGGRGPRRARGGPRPQVHERAVQGFTRRKTVTVRARTYYLVLCRAVAGPHLRGRRVEAGRSSARQSGMWRPLAPPSSIRAGRGLAAQAHPVPGAAGGPRSPPSSATGRRRPPSRARSTRSSILPPTALAGSR